jgi:uncharacterized CHY-type Zn-finger protein
MMLPQHEMLYGHLAPHCDSILMAIVFKISIAYVACYAHSSFSSTFILEVPERKKKSRLIISGNSKDSVNIVHAP